MRNINAARGRIPILIAGLMLLASCSPKSIPAGTCLLGSRLAFWLGETTHWFFFKTEVRPWEVTVYGPSGTAWETSVPYDLIENWQHTYQPKRRLVVYGERYAGWELPTKPQALEPDKKYHVEIWSDAGRGMIDMVAGRPVPQCSNAAR